MPSFSSLKNNLISEYGNLSEGFAVAFIGGILCAFAGVNIPIGVVGILCAVCLGLLFLKQAYRFRPILILSFFGILGIGAVSYRMKNVSAPILEKPVYQAILTGTVTEVTHLMSEQKIVLSNVRQLNNQTLQTPDKIRLKFNQAEPLLSVGDNLRVQADIRPPRQPILPHSFNEARTLYFQKIGAVGFVHKILSLQKGENSFRTETDKIRSAIRLRIQQILPDETARIAIPLTIGEQGVVSPELYDLFRRGGIVHILSVSGFHLSLLALFLFFLIRGFLSLFPAISEYLSPKKIAAVVTLLGTGSYILISGMQVPAIRSWIMIAIVLIATFFDRNALSIRSLSIAAVFILLIKPELIFNIGFQLSFTAVLIIVCLYRPLRQRLLPQFKDNRLLRFMRAVIGFMIMTFLITLATTPLVIYHFNQLAPYSILGNVLCTTILSFWVMPCLFLAIPLIPAGGDGLFLKGAGVGINYIVAVCDKIKDLPFSIINLPSGSEEALLIFMTGLILFCLMKTRLRLIGMLLCLIGVVANHTIARPDILIGDRGQTVAIREDNGKLRFLKLYPRSNTAQVWLQNNGEEKEQISISPSDTYQVKGKIISFDTESCPTADICLLSNDIKTGNRTYPINQNYLIYIQSGKINVKSP